MKSTLTLVTLLLLTAPVLFANPAPGNLPPPMPDGGATAILTILGAGSLFAIRKLTRK